MCKIEKPISEFYIDKTRMPGYSSRCKRCSLLSGKEFKEKYPKYNKKYYQKHKKEYNKKYRKLHPLISKKCEYCGKEFLARQKQAYCLSLECKKAKNRERGRKYHWKNREKILKRNKELHLPKRGYRKDGKLAKKCQNCNQEFIAIHGAQKRCLICQKKIREEQNRRWSRLFYKKNKEKILKRQKEYLQKPEVKKYKSEQRKRCYQNQKKVKTCEYCGKAFTPDHGGHKCCSEDCKRLRILKQLKKQRKKYYLKNPQKYRALRKKWREKNKERINIYQNERRNNNPKFKLDYNIASAISTALKGNKNRKKWQTLVGYSLEDLIKHLEFHFEPWMNWDNYGKKSEKWAVDHSIPTTWFEYEMPYSPEFKACWSLQNLRPMNFGDNSRKSNRGTSEQLIEYCLILLKIYN